ncbi:MAG: GspH/FimT family pseudopilin [Candidatus Binatia bacterium]
MSPYLSFATSRSFPRPLGRAGFGLTELMVTIAILGILTGLTTVSFRETREIYKLRGATWDVFSQLQAARMAAVKDNNRYHVSVSGPTLRIHNDRNNDGVEDDGEPIITRDLSADSAWMTFTASDVVTFTARGTSLATVTITITNQFGHSKGVVVSRAGRVRVL